ncbi:2-octaprenyl-6-methoxyphenol hydroxylase [Aureimonas sp. SA4125]|uniref:UbiH/UbiF family hydroxylase n=1 Tax=Aureimonas sp. SA4125 TaxID=2826993 RepID=UPI001CC3FCF7|nr:UbiH/UbiF family hydroxylase [Aureimonas sp. SA4125]BDA84575.1 2-octaprenyl-6-methoxyphenol hydroxylase [Aureimonas sp. SA4125]
MGHLKAEIGVVGGGLAGYATAIAFALEGFDTVLLAPAPSREDGRSTALLGPSVAFLESLGVFEGLRAKAEALTVMRIIDDTGRLMRAPSISFDSREIDLAAFGFNALNADLMQALATRAATLGERLRVIDASVDDVAVEPDGALLRLGDGSSLSVALVVGADGRHSVVRERAKIACRAWSYPQSAIVLNFAHERPHGGISTEFHRTTGPFTQVPLPGRRSSLVWVETPETADLVVDLKPERLERMIEERLHSILGAVTLDGPVQAFPLKGASAARLTAPRVALVGEAAHVFPPIGAQGLNLGLRDAAAIVEAAVAGRDDPGCTMVLSRYEAARRGDVMSRSLGVDLLNRSLLASLLPTQAARAVGLSALAAIPWLRRFAMREGVAPGAGLKGIGRSVREGIGGEHAG